MAKSVKKETAAKKGAAATPASKISPPVDSLQAAGTAETIPGVPTREQVETRAYLLWLQGGREDGSAERYWFQAESEYANLAP